MGKVPDPGPCFDFGTCKETRMYSQGANLVAILRHDESGQGMVEYVLIIAVVALGAAAGMNSVAVVMNSGFTTMAGIFGQYIS